MNKAGSLSIWWLRLFGIFVALFGLVTIKAGGSVLFIAGEARQAAGAYLPFVVWFNFIAGFGYILGGIGLYQRKIWSVWVAALIAAGTLVTFAFFLIHLFSGGAYETRTVAAMTFRSIVWVVAAITAWRLILRPEFRSGGVLS